MDLFQLDVFCVLICDILPYDGTSISLIDKDIKSGWFCTSWQFRRACNNLIRVMWLRRLAPEPACRAATIDQHSAAASSSSGRNMAAAAARRRTYVNSSVCSSFTSPIPSWLLFFFWTQGGLWIFCGQEVDVRHLVKWQLTNQGRWECESEGGAAAGGGVCWQVYLLVLSTYMCALTNQYCCSLATFQNQLFFVCELHNFIRLILFCRHEATPSELRRRKADRPDVTAGGGWASKEA